MPAAPVTSPDPDQNLQPDPDQNLQPDPGQSPQPDPDQNLRLDSDPNREPGADLTPEPGLATRHSTAERSPGLLLWQVTNRWQAAQRAALKPFGLTHVQFVLLASLTYLAGPQADDAGPSANRASPQAVRASPHADHANPQTEGASPEGEGASPEGEGASRQGDGAARLGSVSQRRLAEHAATDPMMTSQVLRALEQRGLVQRAQDPNDGRARAVTVTSAGARLANQANAAVENCDELFFATLADRLLAFTTDLARLAPPTPTPPS